MYLIVLNCLITRQSTLTEKISEPKTHNRLMITTLLVKTYFKNLNKDRRIKYCRSKIMILLISKLQN